MTEHTDKLREILSTSLQNRNTRYSPTIQEKCVADLVELVPHLPNQAEQIIRAATNISDELCHKGHYRNAFRTAGYILAQADDLPNTGMLCTKATQTLINSAMDARVYQTAFNGIYKFMTIGVAKKIPGMFDFGANAMKAALDDCVQNPNSPKLKAAKFAAGMVARDNHDYSYLWTIARIAEQQSQPVFAIECYAGILEGIRCDTETAQKSDAKEKITQLFLNPTQTCDIYADPNIETAVTKLAYVLGEMSSEEISSISLALQDHGHNALALSITNSYLNNRVDQLEHLNKEEVQNMIELASESLRQLQSEMREHGHLSPQSTKLCIEVAASCGLVMKVQQSFPQNVLDAKGLDVAPYQALDMLFDSRENGRIDFLNCSIGTSGFYPENDPYTNRIYLLCQHIHIHTPHVENAPEIIDTTTAAFKDVLINYADKFYDEAATENMLRDFNRATRPLILIPEGYRSLGPGLRQRRERPQLKLAVS